MSNIPEKVNGVDLFPTENYITVSTGEDKIKEDFLFQKKRLQCAKECAPKLSLKIAKNVKEDLKILFKESKNLKDIRKEIRKFVIDEVQPIIKRLSQDEEEEEEKEIITDIDDPNFNFYPTFSDDDDDDDMEINKNKIEKNKVEKKRWIDYELIEIIDIKQNETGITFEKIFTKNRIGANVTQILVEDPYLHTRDHLRVLLRFILAMKFTYNEFCQIKIRTKINSGKSRIFDDLKERYPDVKHSKLIEMEYNEIVDNLNYVKKKCADKEIDFEFDFLQHLHDRLILFNSGIMASPGRGISIYQMHNYRIFKKWENLRCHGCRIQLFRLKGFDIIKDNIYTISI